MEMEMDPKARTTDPNDRPLVGRRVLVVDDDPLQRRLVRGALGRLGCDAPVEAGDGKEALDLLSASGVEVDLAICDLQMAGMDGIELLRHLGERKLVRSVIVMSAADRSVLTAVENLARHTGLRVLGHIEKPVTRAKIEACLQTREAATARRPSEAPFTPEEIQAGLDAREFEPFFQPKVSLADGRVAGAEALARWRHSRDGIIAPGRFIGEAEASGLIVPLTWQMLERSFTVARGWHERGIEASIALNLSPVMLGDLGVADRIIAIADDVGIDPSRVTFEVTESTASKDLVPFLSNLTRLRIRNFGVSIDDFGTGYANLEQLGRIPFTELKVDRAFVAGALRDEAARAILESSLLLGRRFGLTTVAEGVETAAELALLRTLQCDLVQGFYFARPMEAAGFEHWVGTHLAASDDAKRQTA